MKVFDVVELKNGNKATIVEVRKDSYKAAIFDNKGTSQWFENITDDNIKKVIISK